MERQPVDSSRLKSVGFDEDTQVMEIEFPKGVVYQYRCDTEGYVKTIYNGLMESESKGRFFNHNILHNVNLTFERVHPVGCTCFVCESPVGLGE